MADVTEMVESVAASIEDAMLAEAWLVEVLRGAGSPGKDVLRAAFERFSLAAITAMREPTPDMALLGAYCADECVSGDPCGKAGLHVWRTMIDAALGESPER